VTTKRNKVRVLIVEDFDDTRDLYADYLKHSGFEVAVADDGMEGVRKAFSVKPDVIVMDLVLPLLDGWEATRRIKQDRRTAHTPVIAVTGYSLNRLTMADRAMGFESLLVKPCLPDDLAAEIRRVLRTTRSGRRAPPGARDGGPARAAPSRSRKKRPPA
jgi:two-component system cell cycle response regulator DivK